MALHLIKLAVGIDDIAHLARVQERRLEQAQQAGEAGRLWHATRNVPRRAEELLDGGSIYWVIKGRIRARQMLAGVETDLDKDGRRYCRLMLAPGLVATDPRPHKAFQGWRYLPSEDAPADLKAAGDAARLPAEMAAELRGLGLL